MDLINTLSGEGTGIAKAGNTHVDYELNIYQHRLTVGNDSNVTGPTEIHGWIRPSFGKHAEVLTLEMNDESTLRFSFEGKDGQIAAHGNIAAIG